MQKKLVLTTLMLFAVGFWFAGCAAEQAKKPAAPPPPPALVAPSISLEMFEVPQYDGYWYYPKKAEPSQGKPDDRGAPLPMSFLFNVTNPNPYPVMLDNFKFTVAFDQDFDLVTVNSIDSIWIPAGKTNQVRATTMITVRSALLSLMVTGGFKLKEKGWTPWQALERWWTGVPNFAVPVSVKEGAFMFVADGQSTVVPFEAVFP